MDNTNKVTVHEFLMMQIQAKTLNFQLRTGMVATKYIDYKNIYEYYLSQKEELMKKNVKDAKMQAIQNTCERFNCGQSKVYEAKNEMLKEGVLN